MRQTTMRRLGRKKNSAADDTKRYIIHIDMDCFFASVAMRQNPQWKTRPLAVAHSRGDTGEVSSCNYAAREFGVKGGMWLKRAKELCPSLIVVSYEFDKYEETAEKMFDILFSYFSHVQVVSIDEAFIDASDVCSNDDDVQTLVRKIRDEIERKTGCTASAGIAENILMARIATKRAKPNGQFFVSAISSEETQSMLRELSVDELPGVGYRTRKVLSEKLEVHSVGDLQLKWKKNLQDLFGEKRGTLFYNYCRGIDHRKVVTESNRKSIGVEINWAIRFQTLEQVHGFIDKLANALATKMTEEKLAGKAITLKLKQRRDGEGEAAKYLGHGICDDRSKVVTLDTETNDSIIIRRHCQSLYNALNVPAYELRGVGIQVAKLITVYDKRPSTITLSQFFKVPQARPSTANDNSGIEPNNEKRQQAERIPATNDKRKATTKKTKGKSKRKRNSTMTITDLSSQIDPTVFDELPSEFQSEIMYDLMHKKRQKCGTPAVATNSSSSSTRSSIDRQLPVQNDRIIELDCDVPMKASLPPLPPPKKEEISVSSIMKEVDHWITGLLDNNFPRDELDNYLSRLGSIVSEWITERNRMRDVETLVRRMRRMAERYEMQSVPAVTLQAVTELFNSLLSTIQQQLSSTFGARLPIDPLPSLTTNHVAVP